MPPTLEPPPSRKSTPVSSVQAARDRQTWMDRLTRSGYFVGAVLLHLLIFLIVATWVIFQAPKPPAEDFAKTYVPSAPPPPPPPPKQQSMPVPSHITPTPRAITSNNATMPTFVVPLPTLTTNPVVQDILTKITPQTMTMPNNLDKRLPMIKAMETKSWGRSVQNIEDSNSDPHNVVATFPVYLASYANGDWGCNTHLDGNGKIDAGSLCDLVTKINQWSRNNIKGTVVPTPLEIGGPDLLAKMPPFIFFTGHKDFILTDDEITNLRSYLQNGGAIWGDNSLPGFGSRFDVAFRREMKRVVPDRDKQFENVPLTHEIFTKSWFNLTKVPEGMNYYAEPLQHLDLDGKLAILYTPNDYSDLMFLYVLPDDTTAGPTYVWPNATSPLFTNSSFWYNSSIFFRNFNVQSSIASQQLGMNILGFLLVRFDKELVLTP